MATGMIEELELRNSRPLDPDMLAVFVDGKYVELRDGDKLRSACIYLVVGLGRDGKKRVLSCIAKPGRENLEDWKSVLRGLIERGLRRVMIFIQDDFSGLPLPKASSPTPTSSSARFICNAMPKTISPRIDSSEFQQRWRAIKSSWDVEVGNRSSKVSAIASLSPIPPGSRTRNKRPHYLAFLQFPESIRKSFSTTNVVEAINGQLEIMRRNSGGYFHSEDTLKFKLGIAVSSPEDGRWRTGPQHLCRPFSA